MAAPYQSETPVFRSFNTEKLVTPLILSSYFFTNYFTNRHLNPFTANPVKAYILPYWSNPPFLIFDIRALWRSGPEHVSGAGSERKTERSGPKIE